MPDSFLRVVNARQHNLKGVTVDLPHRKLIVVTGPSGSGKSSLAFDTIYAEGQRRYIESLSTYAKQFLERMPKPLVDRIEGIAPAIAIEQRNPTVSSRSTVGTATEVYDYLRLLWARVGVQYCRVCGARVIRDSPATAADQTRTLGGIPIQIAFPLPDSARHSHTAIVDNLRAMGFVRIQIGGTPTHLDDLPPDTDLSTAADLLIVVDRLSDPTSAGARLEEALAQAMAEGDGIAVVLHPTGRLRFTEHPACSNCDTPAATLSPGLFSFNNPRGACAGCNGFGAVLEYDESLVVPDPKRSLLNGAIDPWTKPRYEARRRLLYDTARKLGADTSAAWASLSAPIKRELLYGKQGRYLGVFPFLTSLEEKRYKQYIRVFLRQYQLAKQCPACGGTRLNEQALSIRIGDDTIAKVSSLALTEMRGWLGRIELTDTSRRVAQDVLTELVARVEYLTQVGLGYLTLDRQTRTLSGGEAQRISLANALGARLVDSLYVLDEPSIGLHPRDTDRLLGILEQLRDAGNTVIVVEHDLEAIRRADYMVELGPASGERGGRLVHAGPPDSALATLTGEYLTGVKRIGVPSGRRAVTGRKLRITGARLHNLVSADVEIPLGTLVAVTGVSGSGKSTLVHDVIYRQLEARLTGESSLKVHLGEVAGAIDSMSGHEWIESVVMIDQSPIGRSPRSNPITYVKGFDEIRELFADQPLSRSRRYTPATFSFNTAGGRCEQCDGAGQVMVEMVFLADVFVPCETCGGRRFKREVLD
ncbi:MAG: excinuclease ABC subunit UvrA, partial [Gemmatimonadales bacterium]